ncbi:MAG: Fic/DOC family N-terminal domain-containing protein [Paenirhodobacter sp.]
MLIDTLALQEAKASSEVENIVTMQDELFQAEVVPHDSQSPAAKEVARYRNGRRLGHRRLIETDGLIPNSTIIDMFRLLKDRDDGFRAMPGTALKNERSGETIFVPPQDANVDHVRQPNGKHLRNAHTGRRDQPEHRGVGDRSDRTVGAKAMRGIDQPPDAPGILVGGAAPVTGAAKAVSQGHFMARIFGMQRNREAAYRQQTVASLLGRWCPLAHGRRRDDTLTAMLGEAQKDARVKRKNALFAGHEVGAEN